MNIVTARSSTEAAKKNREAEDSADDHYQVVCKLVRHQLPTGYEESLEAYRRFYHVNAVLLFPHVPDLSWIWISFAGTFVYGCYM